MQFKNNIAYDKATKKWHYKFKHNNSSFKGSTDNQGTQEEILKKMLARKKELRDIQHGYEVDRTVNDAIQGILDTHFKHLSGYNSYRSHADCVRKYFNKKRPVQHIYIIASDVRLDMIENEYAEATINQRLNILRQAAKYAFDKKWIHDAPAGQIKLFTPNNERTTWLEKEDLALFAEFAPNELFRRLMLFAAYTGLRTAEIWRIEQKHLSGNNDLHVLGKGHKDRYIPINDYSADFIRQYCPLIQHLSKSHKNQQMVKTCTNAVESLKGNENLREKARVFTFHDLRHCYGTWLGKSCKKDTDRIMRLMGHSTILMVRRYVARSTDDLREAIPDMPQSTRTVALKSVQ